jgi:hypothetical protein
MKRDAAVTRLPLVILAVILAGFSGIRVSAAEAVSPEYQLKAVFLWRLSQFVQWPSGTFTDAESPLVIGVIGENPFGDALEVAVQGETVNSRKIVIRHYRDISEVQRCQILYVSQSEKANVKMITRLLGRRPILTVSDIEGFSREHGGMIRFIAEKNKILLRVNLGPVHAAKLTLDSRLLRMAEVVSN